MSEQQDPRFELVPLGALNVDMTYQKELNLGWARKIARDFDPAVFEEPQVSKRADGSYWLLDGQHRCRGLRELGMPDDHPVRCKVRTGLTVSDEAAIYWKLNKLRKNTKAVETFKAQLAAGDPRAKAIEEVVRRAGLRLLLSGHRAGPGQIEAVDSLGFIYDRGGADLLYETLDILRAAWPDEASAFRGEIIRGAGVFVSRYRGEYAVTRVIHVLGRVTPSTLVRRGAAQRSEHGGDSRTGTARAIRAIYNKGLRSRLLSEWTYRASTPRQAAS